MKLTGNLIDFFNAHSIDISELKDKEINLVIHIIYLFFNISLWYKTGITTKLKLYNELVQYNLENIVDTNKKSDLHNIPFELKPNYITFIFEALHRYNTTKEHCIKSINYMNNNNVEYNTLYIHNTEHIFIIFIYINNVLIINAKDLNVYMEDNLINSIDKICELLGSNKKFSYQFINVCLNGGYLMSNNMYFKRSDLYRIYNL